MSLLSRGLGRSPFSDNALEQKSYPTDAQAVKTIVARTPSIQYLTLNSRDRNQTSTTGTLVKQNWNNFRLQRPQNIMNAYATRLGVSEVRFPFYVPNVNSTNNSVFIGMFNTALTISVYLVQPKERFYDGASLASAINQTMAGVASAGSLVVVSGPLVSPNVPTIPLFAYNANLGIITVTPQSSSFSIFAYNPSDPIPTEAQYNATPSLSLLLGLPYIGVLGNNYPVGSPLVGQPTSLNYTDYIDIVSEKFNQYASARDGSSDNNFNRSLMCRVYITDDVSLQQGSTGQSTNAPFTIHRQFKNPKMVEWNKEASIDWLDISVYDQFGSLLLLPVYTYGTPAGVSSDVGAYPDFQITLVASQD